ncbi:spore photoproduct lyase [Haloplasma contractile]|uniref:Spore photoproduct lyase protein n=1 Tax=Haloplasma contractile SSD-17B TaxID=1033810 RepID=U2FQW3_9MOLU|nr:spore photoproduct lyase [Haloplasma contractile]ERJ13399.1 Spore photoproduct lyase protein [Haloplasma contractile SSD-17B]
MFVPKRYVFERDTLDYPLGQELHDQLTSQNKNVIVLKSNRAVLDKLTSLEEKFHYGKETLILSVRRSFKFMSCRPSAHYQMPVATGCMGRCEYCYLNTQLGDKPYVRAYVNTEEILDHAKKYIDKRGKMTLFEGASTSDPLPVEPYTHGLEKSIKYFADQDQGHFRFVTKYSNVEPLLNIDHNNHTDIRFSINTNSIIDAYEHYTSKLDLRINAAKKIGDAGYQLGFIIAPVFMYDGWRKEYQALIDQLNRTFKDYKHGKITFEVITHRYTERAKKRIEEVFPETGLPMDKEERKFKWGQFGYGKWIYKPEDMDEVKEFFTERLTNMDFETELKYIV